MSARRAHPRTPCRAAPCAARLRCAALLPCCCPRSSPLDHGSKLGGGGGAARDCGRGVVVAGENGASIGGGHLHHAAERRAEGEGNFPSNGSAPGLQLPARERVSTRKTGHRPSRRTHVENVWARKVAKARQAPGEARCTQSRCRDCCAIGPPVITETARVAAQGQRVFAAKVQPGFLSPRGGAASTCHAGDEVRRRASTCDSAQCKARTVGLLAGPVAMGARAG